MRQRKAAKRQTEEVQQRSDVLLGFLVLHADRFYLLPLVDECRTASRPSCSAAQNLSPLTSFPLFFLSLCPFKFSQLQEVQTETVLLGALQSFCFHFQKAP